MLFWQEYRIDSHTYNEKKFDPIILRWRIKYIKCLVEFLEQSNCSNPTICHWWLKQEEIKSEFVAKSLR